MKPEDQDRSDQQKNGHTIHRPLLAHPSTFLGLALALALAPAPPCCPAGRPKSDCRGRREKSGVNAKEQHAVVPC